jgi:hypothetical protein
MLQCWKRPADTPAEEQALSIATHEAGHAVAAALEGLYVYGMRMIDTNGVTSHEPAEDAGAEARICVGGYAAEAMFMGYIWHDPLEELEGGHFDQYKQLCPHATTEEAEAGFAALIAKQVERFRDHEELIAVLVNELMEAAEFGDGTVQGNDADIYLREIPLYARRLEQDHADWLWRMGLDEYRTTCDM